MIHSVTFDHFRGLEHLELNNLSQITLLTGKNNAGKSSVLEGIFLLMDHLDAGSFRNINSFRGLFSNMTPSSMWEPAFYNLDTGTPLEIKMTMDGKVCNLRYERDDSFVPADKDDTAHTVFNQFSASGKSTYALKFHFTIGKEYQETGAFFINESGALRNLTTSLPNNKIFLLPTTYFWNFSINQDALLANMIGQMELSGVKGKILNGLKIMEPTISDIMTLSVNGQMQVYVKIMDRLLPIKLAGEGVNRLLLYLLNILTNQNSLVLIDEIDAGIHYSAMEKMWRFLAEAAKESGSQIIASTHSYECIDHSVDGISNAGMLDQFCLYRINRNGKDVTPVFYSGNLVKEAIAAFMEVR